jgi:hypothetical protein
MAYTVLKSFVSPLLDITGLGKSFFSCFGLQFLPPEETSKLVADFT